jgi:hypothetical protein
MVGVITTGTGVPIGVRDVRQEPAGPAGKPDDESLASGVSMQRLGDVISLSANAFSAGDPREALASKAGLDLAIAAGRQSLSILAEIGDLAGRASDPAAPAEARAVQDQALRGLLSRLGEVVDQAIAGGARLLAGDSLNLGNGDTVAGLDMRLSARESAVSLARASVATLGDAQAAASAAKESFSRVSAGLVRLQEAASAFGVHAQALAALDKSVATGVVGDLDAESARLLALQVRQALAGGDQAIANAGAGILSHFRG